MRHQNGREEKKNIAMHSIKIKGRLYIHKRNCGSYEKIYKERSIPCDKIIMCCNKIRYKKKKMLSPLMKGTLYNSSLAQLQSGC